MIIKTRGIKFWIGLLAGILAVVIILMFFFGVILLLLPIVIILVVIGFFIRLLRKLKREKKEAYQFGSKGKLESNKYVDVEYKVKEEKKE
jgi:uncharacterized membrane protein